jgi:hypothetical protein
MTKPKIALTDKRLSVVRRVLAAYKPGMTITDLRKATEAPVADVCKAVRVLSNAGKIKHPVYHSKPGDEIRKVMGGPLLNVAMREGFRRDIPEYMLAQIEAFPREKVRELPPSGYSPSFAQFLGGKAAWVG